MRRLWVLPVAGLAAYFSGCSDDPTGSNASPAVQGDAGGHHAGTGGKPAVVPSSSSGGAGALPAQSTGGRAQVPEAAPPTTDAGHRDAAGDVSHDSTSAQPEASVDGGKSFLDGGGDAADSDGGIDAGAGSGPTCLQVDGGAGWPPSLAASTSPECIVTCDGDQCGSACASGAPCDSGCCAGNQATLTSGAYASPDPTRRAAMVRDSSGTLYGLRIEGGQYWETPVTGPSVYVYDLDCQSWITPPFGGTPVCTAGMFGYPLLAVGGSPTQRAVYVAYGGGGLVTPKFRFGTKAGTQWSFEDLSLPPVSLAADPQGTAWLSSNGKLYRRRGANRWDPSPVPCGVSVGSIAFDDAGALYLATGKNQIWRRDPAGSWAAETTPGVALSVYTGAGSVHYLAAGFSSGGPYVFNYGRRIGTTWTEHSIFYDVKPNYTLYDYDLALDGCGAPHLAVTTADLSVYYWELQYVRWTAAGWRSTSVYQTLDPQGAAIGVGASNAEIVFYAGILNASDYPVMGTATIPLK